MYRFLLLVFCFFSFTVFTQTVSPFNNLSANDSQEGAYSFIVSGHFYGGSSNSTHYPTNTLLANLDWINSTDATMLICLGDLFKDISNEIPNYRASFFDKLKKPLYNAVGNHDLTGSIYQDNFGETFYYFELNGDIHCILDTEISNGDLIDEQLKMIKEIAAKCNNSKINNTFFYAHRTIWKNSYSALDRLFVDNTQGIGEPNFKKDVLPILNQISEKSTVFWFAGSLGPAPASFFHFQDKDNDVTYIATAIRGLLRDAMLVVDVKDGEVSFRTKSLTGQDLQPLTYYDVPYWVDNVGVEPFNWRLFPYYVQLMITHRYFWIGSLFGILFLVFSLYVFKRFKNKRTQSSHS